MHVGPWKLKKADNSSPSTLSSFVNFSKFSNFGGVFKANCVVELVGLRGPTSIKYLYLTLNMPKRQVLKNQSHEDSETVIDS